MGMATIRAKGEKKSRSEQNKERVWAAVTSCLTNVPPTLLRAVAAAAAGAAAPAGGRGEALGSVGRFPSNSRPQELTAIGTLGANPVGRGRTTPPPPLTSLVSLASSLGAPQCAPAARVLDGGTPEPHTGAKRREHEAPAREAGLLHPRGTSSPALAAVRSTPGQAGSCDASLCVRGRRRGLLGRSWSLLPRLLAPRASSLASQDAAASILPAAQLTRLQSCN
ncbi:uncharacterized protein LOC124243707 [Equus quagga]|uniref:uncharacterized protein LOC124243707 n=1 Tax=Equus quagga TaxID=89248 RepID=UPI001EE2055F|nr:uncharacterized protein LOC124243707 [Equus quagga]